MQKPESTVAVVGIVVNTQFHFITLHVRTLAGRPTIAQATLPPSDNKHCLQVDLAFTLHLLKHKRSVKCGAVPKAWHGLANSF